MRPSRLLLVLGLAIATRLVLFILSTRDMDVLVRDGDALRYHHRAQALLRYHSFAKPWPDGEWHPDATYSPGYGVFLAAVYSVFGERPKVAIMVQCLLVSAGITLFCWILARFLPSGIASFAGLLWALDPFVGLHDMTLMTEGIATAVVGVGLGLLLTAEGLPSARTKGYALYGAIAGIGALVRPALQFWGLSCLVPVLGRALLKRSRQQALSVALALITCMLVMAPWVVRNVIVIGTPKLTTFGGHQLFFYWAGCVVAGETGHSLEEVQAQLHQEERALLEDWRLQTEADRVLTTKALDILARHPVPIMKCCAAGWVSTILGPNRAFWHRMVRPGKLADVLCWAYWGLYMLVLSLACYGLFAPRGLGRTQKAIVLLSALYLVLVAGPVGYARFRVPIMPHVYLLAAVACRALATRGRTESC